MLTAIETTGTLKSQGELQLDAELPDSAPERVRVIVLFDESETEIAEEEWHRFLASNEAFEFLRDEPDLYTLADGKPIRDEE
jgi:hypothetical protein